MKSIVALVKTFRGEEFIRAMTLSIYPHVDKIVFVNSALSWTGGKGNTCYEEISKMMKEDGLKDKIISMECTTTDQLQQCDYGYQWIKKNLEADYVMLIDTDEVWDNENMIRAKAFIEMNPSHLSYRSHIYTYIKSPLYRLDPIEELEPVVFVNTKLPNLGISFRSCDIPFVRIPDVIFHHYVHVRKNFNTVLEKIVTSHSSESEQYQDMSEWIPQVWNKLPQVEGTWREGFHPNVKYKGNWKGIREISRKEMPAVLLDNYFPILEQFGIRRES
jgi:hypothetical protein